MTHRALAVVSAGLLTLIGAPGRAQQVTIKEYAVPGGSHPHDVAPAPDGGVWYTAQFAGALGWLDPSSGKTKQIRLGVGSSPHGVVVGPDGAPWVTDSGLNAIVRVDPATDRVTRFPLPSGASGANLNTAAFDSPGNLWFTGQAGWYGRLNPATGEVDAFPAPRGAGPYGIHALKGGPVYFVSLAASYLGRIDPATMRLTVIDPPSGGQGTRRVWLDSRGVAWITGWNSGKLLRFDPATSSWTDFSVPGTRPQPYAVFVDERDRVWISDFASNAIHRFDPATRSFTTYPIPSRGASVRQLLGRPGEVWGAESGTDKLLVIRYGTGNP